MIQWLYKCDSIYYITTAKDISGYTMYYKEVIKLELFIFFRKSKSFEKFKSFEKSKSFEKFKSFIKRK